MDYENVFLFAGVYDDPTTANYDFDQLDRLRKDERIGNYQAAVFEKRADGKVKVISTTSTTRGKGAGWGAAIGAALGLLFPPSILVTAAEGAAVGALAGNLSKGWFKGDVKQLADQLQPGEAGIVAVAEATTTFDTGVVMQSAKKTQKEQITGNDADTVRSELQSGQTVGAQH